MYDHHVEPNHHVHPREAPDTLALAIVISLWCAGCKYIMKGIFVSTAADFVSFFLLLIDWIASLHKYYLHFLIQTASRIPLSFKMFSKALVIATVVALAAARFGQEGLVQEQIAALSDFGEPGQAATLAGQSPGVLLGGANACDKVCNP